MQPTISVIIPIYNVEQYLEQCLNSVLVDNNLDNLEVICVNDGSTDNSLSICELFAKQYDNIKIISQLNAGLSAARNVGLQNATGLYVCFLDSDDYLLPNVLRKIKEQIINNPKLDVICCNTLANGLDVAFPQNLAFCSGTGVEICEYFYSKMHFAYPTEAWHYICRREFLIYNNIKFKHGFLHEDEDFTPRILLVAQDVLLFSEPIIFYRVKREGAISSNIKKKNFDDILQIIEDLYTLYIQSNAPQLFYEMLFVLLLTTLFKISKTAIPFPTKKIILLNKLANTKQQKRIAKLAKYKISISYRYYIGDLSYLQRKVINVLLMFIR